MLRAPCGNYSKGVRAINQLVFDFFRLCKLNPVEIRKGVWQVKIDDVLMKELDGWRAQGRLLQFTFHQHLAETYGADLICPGSYRLNSILEVIRKQGVLSEARIPHHFFHEPSIRKKILSGFSFDQRAYVVNSSLQYGQYIQFEIAAEAQGLKKKESIHTIVVNLSTGDVLKIALPTHLLQIQNGTDPSVPVSKRKCSFRLAFLKAATTLIDTLAEGENDWAKIAHEKLALEKNQLTEFFDGRTFSDEFKAKKQELQNRLEPKLRINALRGAIILVPFFVYRLVIVDQDGREKTRNLIYDPITNQQFLN